MDSLITVLGGNVWVVFVAIYGVCKGLREGVKKKAMEISSMEEVLFFYTLIGLFMSLPFAGNVFSMPAEYYFYIIIKSFVIFLCWILSFSAIKKLPVGYFGILDMSRVLFSTLLGVVVLGESLAPMQYLGMGLVILGLFLVNFRRIGGEVNAKIVYIVMAFLSCFLNSVSALLDKVIMEADVITEGQLQFWYMFFMVIMYFVYMVSRGNMPKVSSVKNNYWIVILSFLLILGDRLLFIANRMPQSELTVMTVIKQCSVLVTVIMGRVMFGESRFLYKLFCSGLMIAGIAIYVIF